MLPEAKEALNLLISLKIPFILLTNGGGVTEEARSIKLSGELGIPISPASLVQSHTIFRSLLESFADKPILVLGGVHDGCRNVAEHYGFQQAYCPSDLLAYAPASWPFTRLTERELRYVKVRPFPSPTHIVSTLIEHPDRRRFQQDPIRRDPSLSRQSRLGQRRPALHRPPSLQERRLWDTQPRSEQSPTPRLLLQPRPAFWERLPASPFWSGSIPGSDGGCVSQHDGQDFGEVRSFPTNPCNGLTGGQDGGREADKANVRLCESLAASSGQEVRGWDRKGVHGRR